MGLDRYKILFDQAPVCMDEIDADGRLLSMNPAGLAMMGVVSEEAIRGRDYLAFVSPPDKDRVRRLMAEAFAGQACEFEFCAAACEPVSAHPRHFTSCFVPSRDAHGHIDRLIGISQDITQHPEAEAELRRLNRTHAVLSRCNHNLARAITERDLLNAFCTNLVEVGGYCFAWVGYAGRKHPPRVRMVAHAGQEHADFTSEALAWANTGDRPSACRMAVESGRPVVLRDIENEPDLAPWADTALRCGYRSMIALPLKADGTTFGNLSIFSAEVDAFNEPEVALLAELAQDLAFGIHTARARAAEAQQVRQLRDEVERDARKRIAATLHDVVGQSMQAVNLGLKQVRATVVKDAQVPTGLLDQLIAEVGAAIRELRDISQELRPLFLEHLPLLDAIRFHCSETSARAGLAISVLADEVRFDLDERVKEQCFLSIREALSNAIRHAKASRVDVIFDIPSPGRLSIAIIDDGVGFDTHGAFKRPSGLGLCMIRERAESVFGHAHIRSTPGKGTQVRISVPLAKEATPCPSA
jgi:PAS domain S-box-containing protein